MDLSTVKRNPIEKMEPELTDFSYGQKFIHQEFNVEFICVGYKLHSDNTMALIGEIGLNEDKAKYKGEYTIDLFPLFECKAITEVNTNRKFDLPIIPVGAKVECSAARSGDIYTVIGAFVKNNGQVNLQLVHPDKIETVINVPEKFCYPIVQAQPE